MSQDQRQTQRLVAVMASLMVTASLTACGGGSDAPVADAEPADKYVGIWNSNCQTSSYGSTTRDQYELSKAGPAAVNGKQTNLEYSNVTCTGAPTGSQSSSFALTIDGTGTASSKVVDKTTTSEASGSPRKRLFSVEGNLMYVSDGAASQGFDPDGYPTKLNLDQPYTR